MPSVAMDGNRRKMDEPLSEIVVFADDGESLSLFVRWVDREKAWALIGYGVDECRRNEAVPVCGATCNSELACSDTELS